MLRLGADVERLGRISEAKLEATAELVARLRRSQRERRRRAARGADHEPRPTGGERRRAASRRSPRRRLPGPRAERGRGGTRSRSSARSEAARPPSRRVVAVVDVGGGSAQVVVGTRRDGPAWLRSIDLGSQRLTSRLLSADPPGAEAIDARAQEVEALSRERRPAVPRLARLAVGGSARARSGSSGSGSARQELGRALSLLAGTPDRRGRRPLRDR